MSQQQVEEVCLTERIPVGDRGVEVLIFSNGAVSIHYQNSRGEDVSVGMIPAGGAIASFGITDRRESVFIIEGESLIGSRTEELHGVSTNGAIGFDKGDEVFVKVEGMEPLLYRSTYY